MGDRFNCGACSSVVPDGAGVHQRHVRGAPRARRCAASAPTRGRATPTAACAATAAPPARCARRACAPPSARWGVRRLATALRRHHVRPAALQRVHAPLRARSSAWPARAMATYRWGGRSAATPVSTCRPTRPTAGCAGARARPARRAWRRPAGRWRWSTGCAPPSLLCRGDVHQHAVGQQPLRALRQRLPVQPDLRDGHLRPAFPGRTARRQPAP